MKIHYEHIDIPVVSRAPGITFSHMYSMHKYWSKKSPDVVAEYIKHYTEPGETVLDPFCGSGITACEAIRLGRRAIAIDINPMATFITRITLMPVNLSHLQLAFHEIKHACEKPVLELFTTTCCRCNKEAIVEFVVRDGNTPTKIAYICNCSDIRLFKDPDKTDMRLDSLSKKKKVPFWYPNDILLPVIQRERFQYLHELFTNRNLIALSTIFHAIEKLEDVKIQDVMKLAFTASLAKCSRLKPLSRAGNSLRPSLSEGWIAPRFYTPRMWQEVNPWHAFKRSFKQIYEGKKESNSKLKYAKIGSNYNDLYKRDANVVIFTGSADAILNKLLPEQSIHYVLTDPPFGAHIQYLALSTFWGAWLKFDFNFQKELIVNHYRGKTLKDYENHLRKILKSIKKVMIPNRYVHFFYQDVRGPYLHKMLKLMAESNIAPERILHQPPTLSFGEAIRRGKGHCGSYIIRGKLINKSFSLRYSEMTTELRKKIGKAVKTALEIRGGSAQIGTVLHSIYQRLYGEEILVISQHLPAKFIQESIKEFAVIKKNQIQFLNSRKKYEATEDMTDRIRMALLDAKSLNVNNPRRKEKKNQVYQRILRRFQENGITLDDIRNVENDVRDTEVKDHRKLRLPMLLHLFGKILNFKSKLIHDAKNEVIWEANGNAKISFQVTDKEILVKAYQISSEGDIVSEVGTISDEDLERALFKWCQKNPRESDRLIKHLNVSEELTLRVVTPKHSLLKVLGNRELIPEHYLITLKIPKYYNLEPCPGQFYHVICDPDGKRTLTDDGKERGYALTLRRPFSINRIYYTNFDRRVLATPTIIPYEIKEIIKRPISKIDILYRIVGKGTKSLSNVNLGRYLDIIGPLGHGFNINNIGTAVIVAGGIGVAPLVSLAERLRYLGSKIFLYFGALKMELLKPILSSKRQVSFRRADSAVELGYDNTTTEFLKLINNEFMEIGAEKVRVSTDDGSLGKKGLVTALLENDIKLGHLPLSDVTIYACGPSKMMKAISALANKYNIPCQVLLEARMACGIGACFSCTSHIRSKNGKVERKRVCIEGPVFNSEEIIWQD